ncbi:MAG TPA: calcium-binding protein [Ramlibacter sp.]|jgi:Ca2+-binding RTX toxin-like protein
MSTLRGTSGNDFLTGGTGNDWIDGMAGNDTLAGGLGDDSLRGGSGRDFADYTKATSGVLASLFDNSAQDGQGGTDELVDIEGILGSNFNDTLHGYDGADLLEGGNGNDLLLGNSGNDTLLAGAGADNLHGGLGNDVIDGGTIADTFNYTDTNWVHYGGAEAGVSVDLGRQTASDGQGGTDTLLNINAVSGSSNNDMIVGSTTWRYEAFDGNLGDDTIDGGSFSEGMINRVMYNFTSGTGVRVDLAAGTATSGSGNDTLININDVWGSFHQDTLTGSGSAFTETFNGRGGDDTIDGAGGLDVARYDAQVTANLRTGKASDGFGGTDTLRNIEGLRGGSFNDSLVGGNTANEGATRYEFFQGAGGNDTIDGGTGRDRADYSSADLGVQVDLAAGTALDGLGGKDTLRNIEGARGGRFNDTISGDAGDNQLEGGTGSGADRLNGLDGTDTLDGGLGADLLAGGLGDDTYHLDDAADNISGESSLSGGGIDTVITSVDYSASRDYVENLQAATGTASIDLTGNQLANALVGNSGRNILDGAAGADVLSGGKGNDTYRLDNMGDNISGESSASSGGIDTVITSIDYSASRDYVEYLVAAEGTAGVDLRGNQLGNRLTGNAGTNILEGAIGADTLTGGSGADRFVFDSALDSTLAALDRITDFTRGSDKFGLSGLDGNAGQAGHQDFAFIGSKAFSADATGQLRFTVETGKVMLYGSTDADATAEFAVQVDGLTTLAAADFLF